MVFNILAFITLLTTNQGNCHQKEDVRRGLDEANSMVQIENYIKKYNGKCVEYTPYMAIAEMKKTEYVSDFGKKLSYFKKGKNMLEAYLSKHPSDIEARYLRYMVQKQAPRIAGYKKDLKQDKFYVEAKLDHADLPSYYKKEIKQNLK